MADIILDTIINDNIRIYIEYTNIYKLNYINRYYQYILTYDSYTYNKAYDEYIKIRDNIIILENLSQADFLNWITNN